MTHLARESNFTKIMSKTVLLTSVCRPMGPQYGDAPSVGYELLYLPRSAPSRIGSPHRHPPGPLAADKCPRGQRIRCNYSKKLISETKACNYLTFIGEIEIWRRESESSALGGERHRYYA